MRISTQRLELLPMELAHIRALLQNREEFDRLLAPYEVPASWPWEETLGALPFIEAELTAGHGFSVVWMIVHRADRRIIGEGGVSPKPREEQHVLQLGYHIMEDYRRQGFGLEAVRAIVQSAFLNSAAKAIKAETFRTQMGSIRILQRMGFQKVADTDLTYRWQLGRSQYQP